jgi:hypothetical protein
MLTNFTIKSPILLICEKCDFQCCNNRDYDRHLLTRKHKNVDKMLTNVDNFTTKSPHMCLCGKEYKHRQSLSIHKKKCIITLEKEKSDSINDDILQNSCENANILALFKEQLNENKELRNLIVEQNKQLYETNNKLISITNNTNNNTNCNNKTFNLQFFLNETCKHAININEFVDSIKVQIKDLEKVGEIGYAEGISNIFISNLQQLDSHTRPIHCSDSKRETLYIKDEEQWSKDDENKSALTKAIKNVANKNIKKINEWQKIHPEYSNPKSKQNDKYMQIVLNSMSGSSQEESNKNYEKIIKNVIKETIIIK